MSKEEKIDLYLKSIDEIKSIVAGRDTSFIEYSFNGLHYSDEKAETFTRKLIGHIVSRYKKYDMVFDNKMLDFYIAFFKLTIIYCAMEVRKSDLVFESFLKLSKAVEKPFGGKSPLDIMIDDVKAKDKALISSEDDLKTLLHNYNIISELYESCYDEYFASNVRYAVNEFLDSEQLSCFVDDKCFMYAMNILSRCKRNLKEIKYRKVAETKKETTNG